MSKISLATMPRTASTAKAIIFRIWWSMKLLPSTMIRQYSTPSRWKTSETVQRVTVRR